MSQPTHIYRIVHKANIPWLLRHGVTSRSHPQSDPNYINIGNSDLIQMRAHRQVPVPPGGNLNDYVPFYFCTHSVMLFNIHTGRVEGVSARQADVVYLVSSIEKLIECGVPFVFTNRHAYVQAEVEFLADPRDLNKLDWKLLNGRDFKRDPNDPGKLERRAAECLIHQRLPLEALLGIGCLDEATFSFLSQAIKDANMTLKVAKTPQWYF